MNPFDTAVGNLLYQNRLENGLTEKEMADKCGIPLKDYCKFECGQKPMPLKTFIDISIICNIDISAFADNLKHDYNLSAESDKPQIFYCTEEKSFTTDDGIPYTAYNVIIKNGDIIVTRFSDVFLNKEAASHFVEMCNRLSLDPLHVADVIDDAIIM